MDGLTAFPPEPETCRFLFGLTALRGGAVCVPAPRRSGRKRKGIREMSEQKKTSDKKVIIGVACVVLLAAGMFLVWKLNGPQTQAVAGAKAITVQVVHKDGSSKDFELHTNQEFLGRALVEDEIVEDNQSAYGLYILTVDGETADEGNQEWWQVTRSGEYLVTGADETPIADGEHYELTLTVGW